jgi:Sulfotransferase family
MACAKTASSKLASGEVEHSREVRQIAILGGLHRSGTTLLFRMLREHPDISGFANNQDADRWLGLEDEGQFLQSVYPAALKLGRAGKVRV